jgi:tRNA threonylcarbamoyladenosine biosynthesis protein TsaB
LLKVLGIDTSTMTGSVGLLNDLELMGEYTIGNLANHSERLMTMIDLLLKEVNLKLEEIDGIAVALGPGSFTGLRIGVTTAKALAYSLKKPIVGIPTLDALAQHFPLTDRLICPILDARKQEVYSAFYRSDGHKAQRISDYQVSSIEKVLEKIQEPVVFLGNGLLLYQSHIAKALGEKALFADPAHSSPRGGLIAWLGLQRLTQQDQDDPFSLVPLYVRRSDAEIFWEKR